MLRAWQDVICKWRLVPDEPAEEPSRAEKCFDRARSALVEGHLDEALADFEEAAALREHPHHLVGIGDIHLTRGRWHHAEECYQSALALDGANVLALLGRATVQAARGRAESAIDDLERIVAQRPGEPVLRYYLASIWCSAAEQCRSQTSDEVLVITSEYQLRICERAARRILELDVDDDELLRGANRLLVEVVASRRWSWAPEGIAVSLAVLVISLGLTMVVTGGALDSVGLVVSGIVVGSALLYLIVLRFRRQAWQQRAESMAGSIAKPGV